MLPIVFNEIEAESPLRALESEDVNAKRGPVCRDRFGQEKILPAFLAVRDETVTVTCLLKAMNLEIEDVGHRAGRPDGFMPEMK